MGGVILDGSIDLSFESIKDIDKYTIDQRYGLGSV